MLKAFRTLLGLGDAGAEPSPRSTPDPVQVATAALLSQMVDADFEETDQEIGQLRSAVQALLGLDEQDTDELVAQATAEARVSVSLYEFTRVLHRSLDPADKVRVVELLWQIAYADGDLAPEEEFLVRKVARLLHVPDRDFIAAKKRARSQSGAAG